MTNEAHFESKLMRTVPENRWVRKGSSVVRPSVLRASWERGECGAGREARQMIMGLRTMAEWNQWRGHCMQIADRCGCPQMKGLEDVYQAAAL